MINRLRVSFAVLVLAAVSCVVVLFERTPPPARRPRS